MPQKKRRFSVKEAFISRPNNLAPQSRMMSPELLRSLAIKNNFKTAVNSDGVITAVPKSFIPQQAQSDSIFDTWIGTYTYYSKSYQDVMMAFKVFDLMEENMGEVDLILRTYVDEALSIGFVEKPIRISVSDEKAEEFVLDVLNRNNILQRAPQILRAMCKYGNVGVAFDYPVLSNPDFTPDTINVLEDLSLNIINPKNYEIVPDEWNNPVYYRVNTISTYGYTNNYTTPNTSLYQPWNFVNFFIPDMDTAPWGKSILWAMRSAFEQLSILESLLAASRASKVQRLVISIPCPPGDYVDSYNYISEAKGNWLNAIFAEAPNNKAGRKMPGATDILVKPAIEGFSIDKIDSNIDLADTADVDYFLDKILRNSGLPKGYLVGDDVTDRGGTLDAQDLKFSRALVPIQNAFINGMLRVVECILTHGGYNVANLDIEVRLERPVQLSADLIARYKDIIDLVAEFDNVKPEGSEPMSLINKYELYTRLGMPEEIAHLACSTVPVVLDSNDDKLKAFLVGQIVKPAGAESSEDDYGFEESPRWAKHFVSITNKKLYNENSYFVKRLLEFRDAIKTPTKTPIQEWIVPENDRPIGKSTIHA